MNTDKHRYGAVNLRSSAFICGSNSHKLSRRQFTGERNMKIPVYILITCAAVLMTAGVSTASYSFDGFPVVTRTSGTVNGGVYIGYETWGGTTTFTGSFDVPDGTVKWAYLYTGIWGGTEDYEGWVNVTFNNYTGSGLGPVHLQGKNDTNPHVWCSSHGKYWMYYNVTDLTAAGCTNTAVVSKINSTVGGFDGRVYGIVLVAVYEDGSNEVQYWINDGSDSLNYVTPNNDGTTHFDGPLLDNATTAKLTMVHLTGYEPSCDDCLQFNGHPLDTGMIANYFELNTWEVIGYTAPSGNNVRYSRGGDEYVNICNTILTLEQVCGDVTGNGVVNTGDVILLSNYVGYPGYTIQNGWAGDVTGNGVINTGDVILLSNYVGYPGYSLNCT